MTADYCTLASSYVEELRARSSEIDAQRSVPQDLAERLAQDGFYRLCTPKALGGVAAPPKTLAQVCEILANGNGSVAWCVFIGATSQYMFPAASPQLIQELLVDPSLITSGVFAYSGHARSDAATNSWRVSGRWDWGSGCHNADWISGGVLLQDDNCEPILNSGGHPAEARAFFRPKELTIHDNWHTSGLKGSGSSSFTAEDVILADYRIARVDDLSTSEHVNTPLYRFPRFGYLALPIGAIALGMAQDALSEALAVAKSKTPTGSSRSLASRPAFHTEIALADTSLRAAHLTFYNDIDHAWSEAQDQTGSLSTRQKLRTSTAHAVTTAAQVIDRMYTVVGGTSIYEESALQRHFRDVHVASQHMMVSEPVMELAGRVITGVEDNAPGL